MYKLSRVLLGLFASGGSRTTWILIPDPKHTFLLVVVQLESSNLEKKIPSFGL